MSINIEVLINFLGKTYQEIFDAGIIPYKKKPTGFSGSSNVSLDMVKEGVYLSFSRDERILNEITLTILDQNKTGYRFPNKLPHPLKSEMFRSWVQCELGEPHKFLPPRRRLKRDIGYTDLYNRNNYDIPVSMQLDYDLEEKVRAITYIPTSLLRW